MMKASRIGVARVACLISLLVAVFLSTGGTPAWAETVLSFSLETNPTHARNLFIQEWADRIEEKTDGDVRIEIVHGAAKYEGANVPTALGQGVLDGGAPGWWQMAAFLPDFNLPAMPMFYGREKHIVHAIFDGDIGKRLNSEFENKFGVKVLGRWLDLGFGQMFFKKRDIQLLDDLIDLRIRVPGGPGSLTRLRSFGAKPVAIKWPLVREALRNNSIDGLLTSFESVRSEKLWESGIRYAIEDNQIFMQYVPAFSDVAWQKLTADQQTVLIETWEEMVESGRLLAAQHQADARIEAEKNGITRNVPDDDTIARIRDLLMREQFAMTIQLKMDAGLVEASLSKINELEPES